MRTVIGVLRGGPGDYDLSLHSGAAVLDALDKEKYEPRDIFISRGGDWHLFGAPVTPERALRGVDAALVTLHGEGEDGKIQAALDALGVPYAGSGALASARAYDKQQVKEAAKKAGIKIPRTLVVETPSTDGGNLEKLGFEIFRSFPHPALVRPAFGSARDGVAFAGSYHELVRGLESAARIAPRALVEEYIPGRGASVGIIDDFRGQKNYALIPSPHSTHGHHTLGDLARDEKEKMMELARVVHQELGLRHYSRAEFALGTRGIYFLDIETMPALGEGSFWRGALGSVGAKLSDFLDHIISLVKK